VPGACDSGSRVKQRETWRGRSGSCGLRSARLSGGARPEKATIAQLVGMFGTSSCLPAKAEWTHPQHRMMRSATRQHAIRTLVAMIVLLGLGLLGFRLQQFEDAKHADNLVKRLLEADSIEVPRIIAEMEPYRPHDRLRSSIISLANLPRKKTTPCTAGIATHRSAVAQSPSYNPSRRFS